MTITATKFSDKQWSNIEAGVVTLSHDAVCPDQGRL